MSPFTIELTKNLRQVGLPPGAEVAELAGERLFIGVDLLVGGESVFAFGLVRTLIAFEERVGVVSLKVPLQMILESGTEAHSTGKGSII